MPVNHDNLIATYNEQVAFIDELKGEIVEAKQRSNHLDEVHDYEVTMLMATKLANQIAELVMYTMCDDELPMLDLPVVTPLPEGY